MGRRRTLLRTLGYFWAAPTTVASFGLVLLPMWILGQARPGPWREGAWEWTVRAGSRFHRWYARDWGATTLGWCILFATPADAVSLAVHERRHVAQNLVLGPLFLPIYGLLWLLFRYQEHPLERDARRAGRDVV